MKRGFLHTIQAFEDVTGLQVCVYDFGGHIEFSKSNLVPAKYTIHRSPFCMKVKKNRHPLCIRSDHHGVIPLCREKREIFTFTCHAGVSEIIIPVFRADLLQCIAFLGPFVRELTKPQTGLQVLDEKKVDKLLSLAPLVRGFLSESVAKAETQKQRLAPARGRIISEFIETNLRDAPGLADLSKHLFLSRSRTAHLVRELTGSSFRELKDQIRLHVAKSLLAASNAKLELVADQAGFSDKDYFCRFFKKKTGLTPTRFRKKFFGYEV